MSKTYAQKDQPKKKGKVAEETNGATLHVDFRYGVTTWT